jgi:uncharacterized protein YaiI (UPF0178 family)
VISVGEPEIPETRVRMMKLWIDADAAPQGVKEICFRTSERLRLDTVLVANHRVMIPAGYVHVTAIRVNGTRDAADRYIAQHAEAGDVAVTQDIPLAAILVPKGVAVIDPRGEEFSGRASGNACRCGTSWMDCGPPGSTPAGTERTGRARSRRSRMRSTERSLAR